ncbi:cation transporter, partial [Candidatus Woesearchaeota archaeon]|nr:cation transporter [Candidatus Woesearchaeota archaeon]
MKSENINVQGMHCQSCVKTITSELSEEKGVNEVKVDLANDNVFVNYNEDEISSNKIKEIITSLGFSTDGKKPKKKNGFWKGLMYGLIPHTGCIAFLIGSVFGVSVLMKFFKPLLMSRYFFHFLILLSLAFATLSSVLYLKNNKLLSLNGIKKKKSYLATMYGLTIGINLLLFFVIFPLAANVSIAGPTGNAILDDTSQIELDVDIPCSGHAPLISEELKTIEGVLGIEYKSGNFIVTYDDSKTNEEEILSLEVFDEYSAKVVQNQNLPKTLNKVKSTTGGSCGSSGSCDGSCGGT